MLITKEQLELLKHTDSLECPVTKLNQIFVTYSKPEG